MDRQEQADAIINKVKELRKKQTAFFKGQKSMLPECKALEKEIDKMIIQYDSPQTSLLDGQ